MTLKKLEHLPSETEDYASYLFNDDYPKRR